jgi:putative hydrolase of the HAD superfamily
MLPMLDAVLFDLDNTLIDRERAFRAVVAETFADATTRSDITRVDERGQGDRSALFAYWELHGGGRMDHATLAAKIAERLVPDEQLLAGLRMVSRSKKVGIVTNGGSVGQRLKLRAAGLDQVIPGDHVWISAETGCAKPAPAIFRQACAGLGVAPAAALYVGDHPPHDATGPASAGMRFRIVETSLDAERLARLIREEDSP